MERRSPDRHSPPQAGEVTYGHSPGQRNGLERRSPDRHSPPQAGGLAYGHPPGPRNGLERRLQPAQPAPGGRSHVRPSPRTAQWLGTPASAGTARRRRAASRTAIPPDSATAWNAGFSRHSPPRAGGVTYGHPSRRRHGLERRLQPAQPAAGGRSHVRPSLRRLSRDTNSCAVGRHEAVSQLRRYALCGPPARVPAEAGVPSHRVIRRNGSTRSAGLRPACRLKPAFQAVALSGGTALRALRACGPRAGLKTGAPSHRVIRRNGSTRSAGLRPACRSEDRRSQPPRHPAEQLCALCGPAARVPV